MHGERGRESEEKRDTCVIQTLKLVCLSCSFDIDAVLYHLLNHDKGFIVPEAQMKRSLGPARWFAPSDAGETSKTPVLTPLREGPVHGSQREISRASSNVENVKKLKPYQRGNLEAAVNEVVEDPGRCFDHILNNAKAQTTLGPQRSRESAWATIASKAGFEDPFDLDPDLIFTVMGAMDRAGYRSAELYLDTAKQAHIQRGRPWTSQLAQAAKQARRACQRHRGPAKQAQPLPLLKLAGLPFETNPVVKGGPCCPIRATLLTSWWLLREIEASQAQPDDIRIDADLQLIHWRLPSSKTDWQALGAIRTHACSCTCGSNINSCPFHQMEEQLRYVAKVNSKWLFPSQNGDKTTKAGWADTFQYVAHQLGAETHDSNGRRLYTGHSARATGAVHMANTQVELWRIRLFGRWGSDCFKQYVRDAPLTQLHSLAQETTMRSSILAAKAELTRLLAQVSELKPAQSSIRDQPVECFADCAAAGALVPTSPAPAAPLFVINEAFRGKVRKVARSGAHIQHFLWHTGCFWYFARHGADYTLVDTQPSDRPECSKCFKHPKRPKDDESSSNSSSSSSE